MPHNILALTLIFYNSNSTSYESSFLLVICKIQRFLGTVIFLGVHHRFQVDIRCIIWTRHIQVDFNIKVVCTEQVIKRLVLLLLLLLFLFFLFSRLRALLFFGCFNYQRIYSGSILLNLGYFWLSLSSSEGVMNLALYKFSSHLFPNPLFGSLNVPFPVLIIDQGNTGDLAAPLSVKLLRPLLQRQLHQVGEH